MIEEEGERRFTFLSSNNFNQLPKAQTCFEYVIVRLLRVYLVPMDINSSLFLNNVKQIT